MHFTIITFNHFQSFIVLFEVVTSGFCNNIKQRLCNFLFVKSFWLIFSKFTVTNILPNLSPTLKVKLTFFYWNNLSVFQINQCSIFLIETRSQKLNRSQIVSRNDTVLKINWKFDPIIWRERQWLWNKILYGLLESLYKKGIISDNDWSDLRMVFHDVKEVHVDMER